MPKVKSKRPITALPIPALPSNHEQIEVTQCHRPIAVFAKQDLSKVGFSDLPGEIRNTIYEYTLTVHRTKSVRLRRCANSPSSIGLGLLRTCKKIRKKATGIFWHGNIFRIDMLRLKPQHDDPDQHTLYTNDRPDRALGRLLDTMDSAHLAEMRSFLFAYHNDYSLADLLDVQNTFKRGDVAFRLEILNDSPYLHIGLDNEHSKMDLNSVPVELPISAWLFMKSQLNACGHRSVQKKHLMGFVRWLRIHVLASFEPDGDPFAQHLPRHTSRLTMQPATSRPRLIITCPMLAANRDFTNRCLCGHECEGQLGATGATIASAA